MFSSCDLGPSRGSYSTAERANIHPCPLPCYNDDNDGDVDLRMITIVMIKQYTIFTPETLGDGRPFWAVPYPILFTPRSGWAALFSPLSLLPSLPLSLSLLPSLPLSLSDWGRQFHACRRRRFCSILYYLSLPLLNQRQQFQIILFLKVVCWENNLYQIPSAVKVLYVSMLVFGNMYINNHRRPCRRSIR